MLRYLALLPSRFKNSYRNQQVSRRLAFAALLLAGAALEVEERAVFNFFIFICAVNLVYPFANKWKTRLLLAIYAVLLLLLFVWMFFRGNVYYCTFAALFLALAYLWRKDWAVSGLVFVCCWLWGLSLATAYLGMNYTLTVLLVTMPVVAISVIAFKRSKALQLEDPLALFVCCSFVLMDWFFFTPAPYPSAIIAGQSGVRVVAGFDGDVQFRDRFLFSQLHFVDQYDETSLIVGTKHYLLHFGAAPQNVLVKMDRNGLEYLRSSTDYTSYNLLQCPPGRYFEVGEYPEIEAPQLGYCIEVDRTHLLLAGNNLNRYLIDLDNRRVIMHEQAHGPLSHAGKMVQTTVFGDGLILKTDNGEFYIGELDHDRAGLAWKSTGQHRFPLLMNDALVGQSGYPYVFMFRMLGSVAKLDPLTGRRLASRYLLPGERFLTIDIAHRCLLLTNEWLGFVYILDIDDLRVMDRIFVGPGARRANISRIDGNLFYIASKSGLISINLCERRAEFCPD